MRTTRTTTILMAALLVWGCGGVIKAGEDADDDTTTPPDTMTGDTDTDPADDPADDPATDPLPDTSEDPPPDTVPDPTTDPVPDTAPDPTTDPLPDGSCPLVQIPFEAEDMDHDDGFAEEASSRPYIGTFLESRTDGGGVASWEIDVPCADNWYLWGLVWWSSLYEDSFYWTWDTWPESWVWDVYQQGCSPSASSDWYWDQLSLRTETGSCGDPEEDPAVLPLSAGSHTFFLFGRESGTAVAEFILTNDPAYVPPDPG